MKICSGHKDIASIPYGIDHILCDFFDRGVLQTLFHIINTHGKTREYAVVGMVDLRQFERFLFLSETYAEFIEI